MMGYKIIVTEKHYEGWNRWDYLDNPIQDYPTWDEAQKNIPPFYMLESGFYAASFLVLPSEGADKVVRTQDLSALLGGA